MNSARIRARAGHGAPRGAAACVRPARACGLRGLLAAAAVGAAACGPPGIGAASPAAASGTLFREIARERGIDFVHTVKADGTYRIAEVVGPGCAVFDADGDGRLDILFTNAGDGPGVGLPDRFFRQQPGGRFEDATAASGLGDRGFGTGVAVGDIDNDGDLDVWTGNWGGDTLHVNEGGRFRRRGAEAGVAGPPDGLTTSVAMLDYDLDGFLDVYVVRYVVTIRLETCDGRTAISDYCMPRAYPSAPDSLYRNRGDGTFEDVTVAAGLAGVAAPGLSIAAEDFDGDGWPDLYVGNDGVGNFLWLNQRNGTFRDAAIERGLAFSGQGTAEATMGIAVGDIDGDGERDIVATALPGETTTVYRRGTKGFFEDATGRTGVGPASVPMTGWGVVLPDFDLDGDLDMALVNGRVGRKQRDHTVRGPTPWDEYAEPGHVFLNQNGKCTLVDPARAVFGNDRRVGRSLVAADIDDDGDLDLVTAAIAAPAQVFEYVGPREGRWLRVRCVDPALRRDAYGARVTVRAGGRAFAGAVAPISSYQASGPAAVHFGLGRADTVETIEVVWPGGTRERFPGAGADREVVLERGKGEP